MFRRTKQLLETYIYRLLDRSSFVRGRVPRRRGQIRLEFALSLESRTNPNYSRLLGGWFHFNLKLLGVAQ